MTPTRPNRKLPTRSCKLSAKRKRSSIEINLDPANISSGYTTILTDVLNKYNINEDQDLDADRIDYS